MFIVIFRPHGELNMDTQHIGPFDNAALAYDYLCDCLPALGTCEEGANWGVKYVKELVPPVWTGVHA